MQAKNDGGAPPSDTLGGACRVAERRRMRVAMTVWRWVFGVLLLVVGGAKLALFVPGADGVTVSGGAIVVLAGVIELAAGLACLAHVHTELAAWAVMAIFAIGALSDVGKEEGPWLCDCFGVASEYAVFMSHKWWALAFWAGSLLCVCMERWRD